ncbi:SRPBCC family protein [Streptomyces sp. IB2014 016-6]|uniref:SRPBCC family protein n=1 Tax=Streptomyces sp. IB2014 016-6 TaxID=2517818 RepID=UPI0011C9D78D|nr:SRPBCC family protein [Streptomyces sp. IB2014 016-6]TXL90044.1 SRPBCC family protein [Streptomyces sp. IB2014 016-6]
MSVIEGAVDVDVPIRMAYNQWTQFECFPQFMRGVRLVERSRSSMTHWVTRFGGVTREFDAEITEQRPDDRVVWRTVGTPRLTGSVRFRSLGDTRCRVDFRIEFTPRGAVERAGDALGVIRRQVHEDLRRFKEYIEAQGRETGQWRGTISDGHVRPDADRPPPQMPDWPTG